MMIGTWLRRVILRLAEAGYEWLLAFGIIWLRLAIAAQLRRSMGYHNEI